MLDIKRKTTHRQPCKVTRTYIALDANDRKIFRDAIDDTDQWSAIALEAELRRNGVMISNDTILQHRKGNCNCEGWPDA